MDMVLVLEDPECGLAGLSGLIRTREWLLRLKDDTWSVLEAIAAHDNRLDV